jgi:hypothetical protein
MEQQHWLLRKRASAAMARKARSAEARLIHLDLAGRYSVKAAAAGATDSSYYERLEIGARWLASRTKVDSERQEHLGMANKYSRLRLEAASSGER